MAELQKVLKVTQAQYDTLAAGGTVGSYTGLNSNYIYLIQDDTEYIPTITYAVDAVTRPTSSSDYVVYHITAPTITALTEGLTIRVIKGLSSLWPSDSSGAVKLLQINSLDPIAIFWRYNSFAAWNNFDNAVMTLTYSANARSSTSSYYGYTLQSGFILDFTYDSGNDTYNLYDYGGYHTGTNALTAYSLVGWDALGNRVPVINADGTVGTSFDYSRGVQYWETAVSANQNRGTWTGNAWYPRITATILSSLISRYGLNTLTTQDRLYLKCTKNGRMLEPIGIVKSYPTSADGYYYMLFAKPYQEYTNSTGNQSWTIFINQPVYYFAPNVGVVSLDDSLIGAIATVSAFISANPGSTTATLNSIQIGSTNYAIPTGTVTSVRVQAGTGLSSSQSSAQSSTLNTTISIASGYKLPTTTEWASKQDALPTVVKDRYLHTNASTGALEWTTVSGGTDTKVTQTQTAASSTRYPLLLAGNDISTTTTQTTTATKNYANISATTDGKLYLGGSGYYGYLNLYDNTDLLNASLSSEGSKLRYDTGENYGFRMDCFEIDVYDDSGDATRYHWPYVADTADYTIAVKEELPQIIDLR